MEGTDTGSSSSPFTPAGRYQTALLCLGIMHSHFGHFKQALEVNKPRIFSRWVLRFSFVFGLLSFVPHHSPLIFIYVDQALTVAVQASQQVMFLVLVCLTEKLTFLHVCMCAHSSLQ